MVIRRGRPRSHAPSADGWTCSSSSSRSCVILLGAELFTNGIEWFGHKLGPGRGRGRVGPRRGRDGPARDDDPAHRDPRRRPAPPTRSGIGAILGAPFMLATLAMFVTGVAVLATARSRRPWRRDDGGRPGARPRHALLRDRLRALAIGRRVPAGRPGRCRATRWPRVLLVPLRLLRAGAPRGPRPRRSAEDLAPLRLHRLDRRAPAHPAPPRLRIVSVQVVVALGCDRRRAPTSSWAPCRASPGSLGADQALLALIIAPIATELPEKFNSVIWVRQGKDTLRDGQHHRRDGLPERDPDRRSRSSSPRPAGRSRRVGARLRLGRHRLRLDGA